MPLSQMHARLVPILAFAGLVLSFALRIGTAAAEPITVGAAPGLRALYEEIQPKLAHNAYGKPLYLVSKEEAHLLRGDVYAVVSAPFATADAGFAEAASWCDVLILPFNTKHCFASRSGAGSGLTVRIGRKSDQPPQDAYRIDFRYRVVARTPEYFRIALKADVGPLGTRDYEITLEAIPIDAERTFIHLSYSYGFGTMSHLAMEVYLATAGKNKVGFTVIGKDGQGQPVHIGGMLGATERNTMRYYLAIEAYLNSLAAPPESRLMQRLNEWFAATERYPRQLREMDRLQYLAMKTRETSRLGVAL
jgi:hypothetical protein